MPCRAPLLSTPIQVDNNTPVALESAQVGLWRAFALKAAEWRSGASHRAHEHACVVSENATFDQYKHMCDTAQKVTIAAGHRWKNKFCQRTQRNYDNNFCERKCAH
jgi:hypothetical protein